MSSYQLARAGAAANRLKAKVPSPRKTGRTSLRIASLSEETLHRPCNVVVGCRALRRRHRSIGLSGRRRFAFRRRLWKSARIAEHRDGELPVEPIDVAERLNLAVVTDNGG